MAPTQKSEEIEGLLLELAGADRRDSIRAKTCLPPPLGCGKPITGFKDSLSAKEFGISGFCQDCQDGIFGGDESAETEAVSYNVGPEEAADKAAKAGFEIIWPAGNQLLLDIDTEPDKEMFDKMFPIVEKEFGAQVIDQWASKSGTGRHIVVGLEMEINDITRVALQACLGSDRKRELLSVRRIMEFSDQPTVLFRPPSA